MSVKVFSLSYVEVDRIENLSMFNAGFHYQRIFNHCCLIMRFLQLITLSWKPNDDNSFCSKAEIKVNDLFGILF